MKNNFYLGFLGLQDEFQIDNLVVKGKLPDWLSGTLLRNGPAKFDAGEMRMNHWFDGFALLHRFSFEYGKVSYRSRFLQSNAYKIAKGKGRIGYREFATDPCRFIFSKLSAAFFPSFTDNANINIARIDNRFVALSETPLAIEFNPKTLNTLGVFKYKDRFRGGITTAHPHYDFSRKESINYFLKLSKKSTYNIFVSSEGSLKRNLLSSVEVLSPGYMHSFGVTENYVILCEYPFLLDPLDLVLGGKPFIENYVWRPRRGTRILLVNRSDGKINKIFKTDSFFAFHHVNAFEANGEIVFDIIAYDDTKVIQSLYLSNLYGKNSDPVFAGKLRRYRILSDGSVNCETLFDEDIELSRINYERVNGKEYRYIYGVGIKDVGFKDFYNQLLKMDLQSRNIKYWHENQTYPGEPIFICSPNSSFEDEGIVVSVVLDVKKKISFLLVLDASNFKEIARVELPFYVPFGLHGKYFSEI